MPSTDERLTDVQWEAFAAAHPQDSFQLSLPEDITCLWAQVWDFFLDRLGPLSLPEVEEVWLWDTSNTDEAGLFMTVDLSSKLRIASLAFTPTSLYTTTDRREVPQGPQVAREVIDSLLGMRARLIAEAQKDRVTRVPGQVAAPRSAFALAELCACHGRAYRLTGDPVTGVTELRVTWPTGDPSGLWSLRAEWAPGHSTTDPFRAEVHRRDPASGKRINEEVRPEQAVDLITGGEAASAAHGIPQGSVNTVTVKGLLQALFEAERECLSPAARLVVAHNGAPDLGDPVTEVTVLPYRTDPGTGQGLLGAAADGHADADPALVLFTER
ncbi:hypothetical protein ACOQFV_24085 [Nocardiopsis changdeensis]|uniref:Phage tail protein n=1 Tax=Nocardiopsis changdeensis TaxID=2831969 RepID=A0A975KT49_9ACTN|nr:MULTISPECIES: hypothetical protein [Nocardiopsis]QUX26525.1 hypothetical protein KGD84_33035 [Nocardiopsis changdeensis]QYX40644.1 hypothetical protein K1J57_32105 [Nocardiopsis sp. MT53]